MEGLLTMHILIDVDGAKTDPELFYWDLRAVQSATELLTEAYRDRAWNTNDLFPYYGPWRDRNVVDVLTEDIAVKLEVMREAVREGAEKDPAETTV